MTFDMETAQPIVIIDSLNGYVASCSAWTGTPTRCVNSTLLGQYFAVADSPSCLNTEYYGSSVFCVEAGGSQVVANFSISSEEINSYQSNYRMSVTSDSPGFTAIIVRNQTNPFGGNTIFTVALAISPTDYVGALSLTFTYIPE